MGKREKISRKKNEDNRFRLRLWLLEKNRLPSVRLCGKWRLNGQVPLIFLFFSIKRALDAQDYHFHCSAPVKNPVIIKGQRFNREMSVRWSCFLSTSGHIIKRFRRLIRCFIRVFSSVFAEGRLGPFHFLAPTNSDRFLLRLFVNFSVSTIVCVFFSDVLVCVFSNEFNIW